jgi:CHAD domain-containing protein
MARFPTATSKGISSRQSRPRNVPLPRLHVAMPCDTAFRIVARRYLVSLQANRAATCEGDPAALHEMRLALTGLRTSVALFSPMVADAIGQRIRDELKWLNSRLGAVRDLDVAIARITAADPGKPQDLRRFQSWQEKRAEDHRRLAHSLRSARYRRLIERTSGWIENGPWCTKAGKQAAKKRAVPIGTYGADKLAQWEAKLLKKSRKLRSMGAKKRHRLRFFNKKLTYSIESFADLVSDKRFSNQQAALKHLRRAQKCLGQLNDDVRGRALAVTLRKEGIDAPLPFISLKDKKRLLRAAEDAYRKLAASKPWK